MTLASRFQKALIATAIGIGALYAGAWRAEAGAYVQTNLVSDLSTTGATVVDPELKNPWGVSHSATSPFWTSNQGTSTATLYGVTGTTNISKVNINPSSGFVMIPTTASGPQGPTGQVNNTNTATFLVGNGGNGQFAHFIFANLNGTISAWDTGPASFIQATTAGAVYTGLAIDTAQTRLYAANDAGTGSINVFDSSFNPVTTLPANAFAIPAAISALGLVPFNVRDINGNVYVVYAPAGRPNQTGAPLGAGAVAIFDENGTLIKTLITDSQLAAPWGIALAPAGFGPFSNDILVGNFSFLHSAINAFDPGNGNFLGTIPIDTGSAGPGGLWSLDFGIGGMNGSPTTLYFTDGLNGEVDGLFAAISFVPEPSTLALLAAALGFLGVRRTSRARQQA